MTNEEPDGLPEGVSTEPESNPEPGRRWYQRRAGVLSGLTPTGIVLPLAVLALLIYLLTAGTSSQSESDSEQIAGPPPSPATVVPPTYTLPPLPTTAQADVSAQELSEELQQAWAFVERSDFQSGLAIYQDLASNTPNDPRPQIDWAWALILDDQPDQALAHAYRSVELDPTNAQTMAVLARAYAELGDQDRALGMAQNAVDLDPSSAMAHAVLAQAYWLNGSDQAAVDEAELALAEDENNPEAHRIRGWLYATAEGDLALALQELGRATELQPSLWLRHHEQGLILLKAKEYQQALAALTRALDLHPRPATYAALGEAYYRLGQLAPARAALLQALGTGARLADTFALLAILDAEEGRCVDASLYLEQALSRDPHHQLALDARDLCSQAAIAPAPTPTGSVPQQPTQTAPPFGGQIAFPVWNLETGQYDTYVANADGSERRLVIKEMHQPAFRPDGKWLAVNGELRDHMNLFVVRPDGTGLNEISENIEDGLPSWSPNGESLAFSSTRHEDRQARLYVLDQVPFDGERQLGRVLNSDLYELLGEGPAWTPDNEIIYQGCDYTTTPAQCGLYAIPAAPGPQAPRQLTSHPEDSAPAVAGTRIAFMSNRDGSWDLYLMGTDGSGLVRLTRNPANDGLPTWAPDGSYLAFVSDRGGDWAVWAIRPDGSNLRKLFDLGEGGLASDWQRERISWAP
jgi:TolB protein